jgi:hypothetical protein
MTIRELLNRRKRKAIIIAYSGLVLFVVGLSLGAVGPPWLFIAIPGFAVFVAASMYSLFLIRCPSCREAIGYTVAYPSGPFSISRKIRFCPFCGIALDSALEKKAV